MWEYNIKSHTLKLNGKVITSEVYSGAPGYKNDPSAVNIKDKGPLPPGMYTIQAPYTNKHTGPYTLNLEPAKGNVMYQRDAFRIHGDSTLHPGAASNGCIIASKAIRQRIWTSNDHQLRVTR